MRNLMLKVKNYLGLCSTRGCFRKQAFEIKIELGEEVIVRHLCRKHVNELNKHGSFKGMSVD